LLPVPFLFLRYFGHASAAVVVVLLLLTASSFIYRASATDFARRGVLLVLVFDTLFLCYALLTVAIMFAMRDI
jgi:hypothetical protein